MQVKVTLHQVLRRWAPDFPSDGMTVELKTGATVAEAIAAASLDRLPQHAVAVNRRVVKPGHVLSVDDELDVMPPLAGG